MTSRAGAVVTTVPVEAGSVTVGLQPRTEDLREGEPESFSNESGNVVLHGSNVYAIYWDPENQFHHEWLTNIDSFFQRLGASSGDLGVGLADLGQYRDRTNTGAIYKTVFKGAYSDTSKYPGPGCTDPNLAFTQKPIICITDAQLREQLQSFIASNGLPKGMGSIFYLLTPPGVTVCADAAATHCSDYKVSGTEETKEERESISYKNSFCSYHSDISPTNETAGDEHTILYAVIPWSAGTAGDLSVEATQRVYREGFDCQDGGWSPAKHEEVLEKAKVPNAKEEEQFAAATSEEKNKTLKQRQLEGPHQEEPNQEGKGEFGDYAPGLTDLIVNQIAEEQANTATNPLLNAWQDSEHREATDECRDEFDATVGAGGGLITGAVIADEHTEAGTIANTQLSSPELGQGSYDINNVFNLAEGDCVGGVGLVPRFTAPNPVNSNEIVGLDGMESTVSLLKGESFGPTGPPSTTYATFSWNFGDNTPEVKGFAPGAPLCETPWLSPCAASTFHSYQYGGSYKVTLLVTDVAGNTAKVEHEVKVEGPPPPAPVQPPTGGTVVPAATPGPAGATSPPGTGANIPGPVISERIASTSLRAVIKSGLLARYAVNEEVAGHFEVILNAGLARKLGIHGAPAAGLAQGTPKSIVIAEAILVTTKGARGTEKIRFAKHVLAGLRKASKVPLMLRLVARNASPQNPKTVTALSAATLHR
jgi:hypothetical protein